MNEISPLHKNWGYYKGYYTKIRFEAMVKCVNTVNFKILSTIECFTNRKICGGV